MCWSKLKLKSISPPNNLTTSSHVMFTDSKRKTGNFSKVFLRCSKRCLFCRGLVLSPFDSRKSDVGNTLHVATICLANNKRFNRMDAGLVWKELVMFFRRVVKHCL